MSWQSREKWIEEQYARYRKRTRIAILLWAIVVALIGIALAITSGSSPPTGLRLLSGQVLSACLLVLLLVAAYVSGASRARLLPPPEDMVLYHLRSASRSLAAYVTNGSEEAKKRAVRDLEKVTEDLDTWSWGNLKFLWENTGTQIVELRKNFRGRFIPAVKKADGRTAQSLSGLWLNGVENILELGQLNSDSLKAWNYQLTQKDESGKERLPYVPPRPRLRARMKSKKFELGYLFAGILGPIITYSLAVGIPLADRNTAFYGALVVFGIVVSAYLGRGRSRQKEPTFVPEAVSSQAQA